MKWDVKHDRAKKVIDRFLDNAGYWQESEDLVTGLTDEEKELVNAEVGLLNDRCIRVYSEMNEWMDCIFIVSAEDAERAEKVLQTYYCKYSRHRVHSAGKAD